MQAVAIGTAARAEVQYPIEIPINTNGTPPAIEKSKTSGHCASPRSIGVSARATAATTAAVSKPKSTAVAIRLQNLTPAPAGSVRR